MALSKMLRALAALPLAAACCGLEIDPVTLISPIVNRPFEAKNIPIKAITGGSEADEGYDDDGCRHNSGTSEYQYYVTADPYSYFSALTAEWDPKGGAFLGALPPDVKQWTINTFNSEWQVDHEREYKLESEIAQAHGQPIPAHDGWVMPEEAIPIEKRFQFALKCYEHRGARPVVVAKTALMGAWALRCFLNLQIDHTQLLGGYDEINEKLRPHIKEGETFQLAKWLPIYQQIFDKERLTSEGYMIAGLAYLGMVVRDGNLLLCRDIIERMRKRFEDLDDKAKSKLLLQGLVRERERILHEYVTLESIATDNFIQAIADEEFTRDDLVDSKMLAVAEGLRRIGRFDEAYDWYLALSKLIETQPELRTEMRTQGKAPAADAVQAVQVGWMADLHLAEMTKGGLIHSDEVGGPNRELLRHIIYDGFGKGDYVNPQWKPMTGRDVRDCSFMLDELGKSILLYEYRLGEWPDTLTDLWVKRILPDRNRVNRFYDPVKGDPFQYAKPHARASDLPTRTVLVATDKPLTTNQGEVYLAVLCNLKIVFSTKRPIPGQELPAP
jgi:hypothetical protein